jgi:hypothetical protein
MFLSDRPAPIPFTKNPDRRRDMRFESHVRGTLWHRGLPLPCVLVNYSARGALVEIKGFVPPKGSEVMLALPERGRFLAEVVRIQDDCIGLAFRELSQDQNRSRSVDRPPNGRAVT